MGIVYNTYTLRDKPPINPIVSVISVRSVSVITAGVAAPLVDLLPELFGWLVRWFTKQSRKLVIHADLIPLQAKLALDNRIGRNTA